MYLFRKLKTKWGIESNFQFWLIFCIFGITGTSTLFVKIPVFALIGVNSETPLFIRILVELLIITPAFQVLLLIYGFIFGQFKFFWEFEKKIFGRLFCKRKINT